MSSKRIVCVLLCGAFVASPVFSGEESWVQFVDETSLRMPTPLSDPAVSTSDLEEKDYAWGDLDNDGDIDLVVARKQPFTTPGGRRNVLFMNEGTAEGHAINGVLVDRTAEYIAEFLDLTNDRDIVVVDVDGDGWIDMVTAPANGTEPDSPSRHPRVYINLGESDGEWLGFEYQEARIPDWTTHVNFCAVAYGDVTNDGLPDLYFIDYDALTPNLFDDRLLINDGNGFFLDESEARMTPAMLDSVLGSSVAIRDMNDDGWADVIQNEFGSIYIDYNNGDGIFTNHVPVDSTGAAFFINTGDLNGDGRPDLIVSDDSIDRYLINQGPGVPGEPTGFRSLQFPSATNGFGGNNLAADLDNDGDEDVIITDVDVEIAGCARITDILQNLGGLPNPSFDQQGAPIPAPDLQGVHDVAIFDINGDGFLDIVVGRCSGTKVWINQLYLANLDRKR